MDVDPNTSPSPPPPSHQQSSLGRQRLTSSPPATADADTSIIPAASSSDAKGKRKVTFEDGSDNEDDDLGGGEVTEQSLSDEHESEEEDDEAYERRRQRNISRNLSIMDSLGLRDSSLTPLFPQPDTPSPSSSSRLNRTPQKRRQGKLDRDGYANYLPEPGERQRIAAVLIRPQRRIGRQIEEGAYVDCTQWAVGEERRWRFGHGQGGELEEGEEEYVGGVGLEFRWGPLEKKKRPKTVPAPSPVASGDISEYQMFPEGTCHQCRRRSFKLKMKCRNLDPECNFQFCETCCKRYSYFEFDPDARSYICPFCKGCCNCSNCLRKRNLGHLLQPIGDGLRSGLNANYLRQAAANVPSEAERVDAEGNSLSMQDWLDRLQKPEIVAPFDRVRLVDMDLDVPTPELSTEWTEWMRKQLEPTAASKSGRKIAKKIRVNRGRAGGKGGTAQNGEAGAVGSQVSGEKKRTKRVNGEVSSEKKARGRPRKNPSPGTLASPSPSPWSNNANLGFHVPRPNSSPQSRRQSQFESSLVFLREKEVDSDGDTVGGYSTDAEDGVFTAEGAVAANRVVRFAEADSGEENGDHGGIGYTGESGSDGSRSRSPTPPRRLGFPAIPAPPKTINDFLASIVPQPMTLAQTQTQEALPALPITEELEQVMVEHERDPDHALLAALDVMAADSSFLVPSIPAPTTSTLHTETGADRAGTTVFSETGTVGNGDASPHVTLTTATTQHRQPPPVVRHRSTQGYWSQTRSQVEELLLSQRQFQSSTVTIHNHTPSHSHDHNHSPSDPSFPPPPPYSHSPPSARRSLPDSGPIRASPRTSPRTSRASLDTVVSTAGPMMGPAGTTKQPQTTATSMSDGMAAVINGDGYGSVGSSSSGKGGRAGPDEAAHGLTRAWTRLEPGR